MSEGLIFVERVSRKPRRAGGKIKRIAVPVQNDRILIIEGPQAGIQPRLGQGHPAPAYLLGMAAKDAGAECHCDELAAETNTERW